MSGSPEMGILIQESDVNHEMQKQGQQKLNDRWITQLSPSVTENSLWGTIGLPETAQLSKTQVAILYFILTLVLT